MKKNKQDNKEQKTQPVEREKIETNDGGIAFVRGNHPRKKGFWPQYANLGTGLKSNVVLTDVIEPESKVVNYADNLKDPVNTDISKAEDFNDSHNHYQNLLSEVWNYNDKINGVALWGDSSALVDNSKVWGGFLSARSWPVGYGEYTPESVAEKNKKSFDAQLVGLEIDILNAGEPAPSKWAKTGLQIVGFGNKNTTAIEIRSEDTDVYAKPQSEKRGSFHEGIVFNNCMAEDGIYMSSRNAGGAIGIDFRNTYFTHGAVSLLTAGNQSGIVFNSGKSGQIYGDSKGNLTLAIGENGIKMVDLSGKTFFYLPLRKRHRIIYAILAALFAVWFIVVSIATLLFLFK